MAEYLFRDKLIKAGLSERFKVKSRGVTDAYEKPGTCASSQGVEVNKFDQFYFCQMTYP
jgi:hypothetical protein